MSLAASLNNSENKPQTATAQLNEKNSRAQVSSPCGGCTPKHSLSTVTNASTLKAQSGGCELPCGYISDGILYRGNDEGNRLVELVYRAEKPLPPFGVNPDTETVVVKKVFITEDSLLPLAREVCIRNYLSTVMPGQVAKVKDYHTQDPACTQEDGGRKAFYIVSEFSPGPALSSLFNDTVPFSEEAFKKIVDQLLNIASSLKSFGWTDGQEGYSPDLWQLKNFMVHPETLEIKLVGYGLLSSKSQHHRGKATGVFSAVKDLCVSIKTEELEHLASDRLKKFVLEITSHDSSINTEETLRAALEGVVTTKQPTSPTDSCSSASADSTLLKTLLDSLHELKDREESLNAYLKQAAELWLFGYGSLLWKQNFEFEGSPMRSYIKGWLRLFTQGSTDHRGVPGKPGRCVTLEPADPEARVYGLTFRISEKKKVTAVTALDIREKSSYERHMIVTYPTGVDAPEESRGNDDAKPFLFPSLVYIANTVNEDYLGMCPLDQMAKNIHTSVGASGPNKDYLFFMVDALRNLDLLHGDQHLMDLETACKALAQAESEAKSEAK